MALNFTDPPAVTTSSGRPPFVSEEARAEMQAHVGQWALVAEAHTTPLAGVAKTLGPGYERTARTVGRTEQGRSLFNVYVRYVG